MINTAENNNHSSAVAEKITPQKVREILNIDNNQIVKLCKKVEVKPKKDRKGKVYFSKDDVEILKRIKMSHEKSLKGEIQKKTELPKSNVLIDVPLKNVKPASLDELLISLVQLESKIETKISSLLDEKLDGMDDVVIELINSKVEIENLRNKVNTLTCENFALKNQIKKYKPVGLGLYLKSKSELDSQD